MLEEIMDRRNIEKALLQVQRNKYKTPHFRYQKARVLS